MEGAAMDLPELTIGEAQAAFAGGEWMVAHRSGNTSGCSMQRGQERQQAGSHVQSV